MVDDLEKLREGLRAMPVPEPRHGFVDRVLAVATTAATVTAPVRAPRGVRAILARPSGIWWAAAAGILTAALAWALLLWAHPGVSGEPRVMLALNESREVPLVIDSERDLEGATIRLGTVRPDARADHSL